MTIPKIVNRRRQNGTRRDSRDGDHRTHNPKKVAQVAAAPSISNSSRQLKGFGLGRFRVLSPKPVTAAKNAL